MADEDTKVVEPELKLEAPNMDEQSAAPKEVVAEPEKKEPEAQPEKKEETAEAEPVKDGFSELPEWAKRELGQKQKQVKNRTQELTEAQQRIADLEAMLQTGEKKEPVEAPKQPSMTRAQIQEAAKELRDQERYEENLSAINTSGEKSYGKEWTRALENLATFGNVETPVMQGILATDDPAKVLYELGKNPAEYQRIMELRPERRQTEFVKLSLKAAAAKTVSAAPEPVETVRGRVSPSATLQDSDSDDEWYAKWEAMQAAKRKKTA